MRAVYYYQQAIR